MRRTILRALPGALLVGALGLLPTSAGAATAPLKIMATIPLNSPTFAYPEVVPTMQAGIRAINKAGGINGVPIQLDTCDNGLNINKAQQCAQQAVQNKDIALVGTYATGVTASMYPVLEAAKIPNIPISPSNPTDWTSKMDYPILGDPFGYIGGEMLGLAKAKCKNIAILSYTGPVFDTYVGIALKASKGQKFKTNVVRYPLTTTDWTAAMQQIINNGSDCISLQTAGNTLPGILRAMNGSGKKLRLAMAQPTNDANLAVLGKGLEGSIAVSPTINPTLTPDSKAPALMKRYAKEMKDGGVNSRKQASTSGFSAWLGLQLFAQAARTIPKGKVTSATLVSALNKTVFRPTGVAGTTDFTKPGPLLGADRLKNFAFYVKQVINGRLTVRKDGLIDLASAFKGVDPTKL